MKEMLVHVAETGHSTWLSNIPMYVFSVAEQAFLRFLLCILVVCLGCHGLSTYMSLQLSYRGSLRVMTSPELSPQLIIWILGGLRIWYLHSGPILKYVYSLYSSRSWCNGGLAFGWVAVDIWQVEERGRVPLYFPKLALWAVPGVVV